jgi:hypothetical protein
MMAGRAARPRAGLLKLLIMHAPNECVDYLLMAGAAGLRKPIRIQATLRKRRSKHTSMGCLHVYRNQYSTEWQRSSTYNRQA